MRDSCSQILSSIVVTAVVAIGSVVGASGAPKGSAANGQGKVYVNGVVITQAQRTSLEQAYSAIQSGRYWHDKIPVCGDRRGWQREGRSCRGLIWEDR
jgi:hypothetical protein